MYSLSATIIKTTVYDVAEAQQSFRSFTLPNTPFYFKIQWENELVENTYSSREIVWDFGDGTNAVGLTASHWYKWPGKYRVKVYLTDFKGNPIILENLNDLIVENVMPDIVAFDNFSNTPATIYSLPAGRRTKPLRFYRFNSWQNDAILNGNSYTINLFASGGKSNYISVSSYYDSKWSHLKPYFGFIEFSVNENNFIVQKIIESTITTSTSVYAEKYFDPTSTGKWDIKLRYHLQQKPGTEFCGTSGEIPENKTIHFIEQKPCSVNDVGDVIFLYAYPDTRGLADKDTFNYNYSLDRYPDGVLNYPWNTQIIKTTNNTVSALRFSSNGITVEGPNVPVGPLTGQFIYSFDIFPIKWANTKIPFVITYVDGENYTTKTYPQIQTFSSAITAPSQINGINVFLMEYVDTNPFTSTTQPSAVPVNPKDYIITRSEEVPLFENGCYFAGVLSANREIKTAFLSAVARVRDEPVPISYPGYVYVFQPGQPVFRRYERQVVFDHTKEEQINITYKDIINSYTYGGSGGVNITYAPLTVFGNDTKDYVWVTDSQGDDIYVFDQNGSPINNNFVRTRTFVGNNNIIDTGRFRLVRPGKLGPEPGFVNARGAINSSKISSSPCQIAVNSRGDAWVTLYDSVCSFKFNKDTFYATAVALPDVLDSSTPIISEFVNPTFNAAYNESIDTSVLPYTRTLSYIQSGIQNFVDIILNGPEYPPQTLPAGNTNPTRQSLQDYFYTNKSLIQTKVIKLVNGTFPGVIANPVLSGKCFRDSGYITDAIAADIANNANHRSIDVGLIYFTGPVYETTGGSSVPTLPNDQIYATAAAISSIGPIMAGSLPYEFYNQNERFLLSGFNTIADIVKDKNKTPKTFPNGLSADNTFNEAAAEILKFKNTIQQEVIEFVKTYYPIALYSPNAGGSDSLSAKCFRDTGYIVESIASDLINNANHRSVETGLFYLSGAVLGGILSGTDIPTLPKTQVEGTIAAISAIGSFITGLVVPATFGYSAFGILSSSKYFTDSQNKMVSSFNNFIEIINDKNNTPKTIPSGEVSNILFLSAADTIKNNKLSLQQRTVEYVKENFPFALSSYEVGGSEALSAKCFRDTGFILESLIADLENNANHRSVETGVFYFSGAVLSRMSNTGSSVPTLPEDQVAATIGAISAIGSFITGLNMPVETNYTTYGLLSSDFYFSKQQRKLLNLIDTFAQTIKAPALTAIPPALSQTPIAVSIPSPTTTSYTTFGANPPTYIPQNFYPSLYVYEGRNIAFLIENNFYNPTDYQKMLNIVNTFDNVYDQYKFYTGREPFKYGPTLFNNKSTIASVTATCGVGCGLIGYTGIEIDRNWWNNYYINNLITLNNNLYDQVLFYEFGRNFWFSDSQLYSPTLPFMDGAFAIFMRFITMEKVGVSGAPFNGVTPFSTFKNTLLGLIDTYIAGPYNWDNTFKLDQGVPNALGLGCSDLMASLCYDLTKRFGDEWLNNIWKNTSNKLSATSDQDIIDNFIISSAEAVNLNLVSLFQDVYKWPVSDKVKGLLKDLPISKPYTIVPFNYPVTEDRAQSKYKIQTYKKNIQQQVIEYVKTAFPFALSGATPGSSEALSAKCFRDSGYIIDAICDDIFAGVNYRSVETGAFYFSGAVLARPFNEFSPVPTLPENQVFSTIAAITAIGSYITGLNMPDQPAPFTASGILSTTQTSTQILSVLNLIDVLTYPLKNNGGQVAYLPSVSASQDEKLLAGIVRSNKTNIQRAVSAYVFEKNYLTNNPSLSAEITAKCNRDVGYMIDAITSDLENGTNAKTITYSIAYWDGSTSRIPDTNIPNQRANTIDVINKLRSNILNAVVYNLPYTESEPLVKIDSLISIMVYPLANNGKTVSYSPSGSPTQQDINLGDILLANKSSIQNYVSGYVFEKEYLTQNNLLLSTAIRGFNNFTTIISNSANIPKTSPNGTPTASQLNAAGMIDARRNTIQTYIVNYVKTNYPFALSANYSGGAEALSAKCFRDTGFIIDSIVADLRNGANHRSVETGTFYFSGAVLLRQSNNSFVPTLPYNQIDATISAITAIGTFIQTFTANPQVINLVNTVAKPLITSGSSDAYFPAGAPSTVDIEYSNILQNKKTTIQRLVSSYVFESDYLTFNTQTSAELSLKCNRDVGYMLDAVINDLQTGVDAKSIQYAVAYWDGSTSRLTDVIPSQIPKTLDTINYLKNVSINILNEVNVQKCRRDVGYMVDAVSNDLKTGVNAKSIQYALAYWDGNTTRLPESLIPNQKINTIDTIKILQSKALDVAINNSSSSENLALKKVKTLISTVAYPIQTAGKTLSYDPPGLSPNINRVRIANLLLQNKSTLQKKVSAYVTGNNYLTAGTIFSEKCTRDAGFMIDAVASDLYNGVIAKSVQYGLAYWDGSTTRLPENLIINQIDKTVDTVEFLRNCCIDLFVSNLSASNQVVNDMFRLSKAVAYPLLNNGQQIDYAPPGEPITDAREDAANRLRLNRSRIQSIVRPYVESIISLSPLFAEKCNRDVGLMVDSIISDIESGVTSRSIQYALAYWDGSVARLTDTVPNQRQLTADTVVFLGQVIRDIIHERFFYPAPNEGLFGGTGSDYNAFNGFAGENTILPTSVDVDKNDNVYITYSHPNNSFLMKYNNDGFQRLMIVFPRFTSPQQIITDLDNNIWVSVMNVNSMLDEDDPQVSQTTPFINSRRDRLYFYSADGTRSFKREFPFIGDMTMDNAGNIWFNSGINQLTRINFENNPQTFTVGNPANNLTYVQEFGGIAGDMSGFLWVINNAENRLVLFDTENPKDVGSEDLIGFVLPNISLTIPPENQNSYYLTTGDFSGIRWLMRNRRDVSQNAPRLVDGKSTLFTIKAPDSFLVKKNENYNLNEKIKSFVMQERLLNSNKLFDEFTNALLNGDNKTTTELGKTIYERITNYVDNHSNIDTCTLNSLDSLYKQLGFSLKKYFGVMPVNVRRIFDILTINHKKLFGSTNTYNTNFTLSSCYYDIKNNLGNEISIENGRFIAGKPIISYELFSEIYTLITNTMVPEQGVFLGKPFPLSGVKYDWGWSLVLGSRDQQGKDVGRYYKFFEYIPTDRSDEIYDNIIDFKDDLTTLTIFNSSYNDWTKLGGYMDAAIGSMLYDGLELYNK